MAISERSPDVDPIGDTGPIDWATIESDHSSDERALEAGEINQTSAERERQAARSDELRRETEERIIQEKRKEKEERQRQVEEQRQRRLEEERKRLAEEERLKTRGESSQLNQLSASDPNWRRKKKKKKKDSGTITCDLCNIKCTGQSAMDMHLRGKAHKTKERQAKWSSANEELSSHYTSIAAAPSGAGNAIYGREDETRDVENSAGSSVAAVRNTAVAPSSALSTASDGRRYISPSSSRAHQGQAGEEKGPDAREEDGSKRTDGVQAPQPGKAQRKDISSGTSGAGDYAPRKAAAEEGGTLLKGNDLPNVTMPKASPGTGDVRSNVDVSLRSTPSEATATLNAIKPGVVVTTEGKLPEKNFAPHHSVGAGEKKLTTETNSLPSPSKQKLDVVDSASKNQEKPIISSVGPRPFEKNGPKSPGNESKPSTNTEQPGSSGGVKSSAGVRPSESVEARKFVSNLKPTGQVLKNMPSSNVQEHPQSTGSGKDQTKNAHSEPVADRKKAVENLMDASEGEAKQGTAVMAPPSMEHSNAINAQGGPLGDSDRTPRDPQPSTGVPLSVPAPRPMLRSSPAPNGTGAGSLPNGKKRKRFEIAPPLSKGEGHYHELSRRDERTGKEDRCASTSNDRHYEVIGSQRRRLDDGTDDESRHRDRVWNKSRDDGNSGDNHIERMGPAAVTPLPAPVGEVTRQGSPVTDTNLEKYPLVPKEWMEGKMTMAEWRELRTFAFTKGDDVDKLAYKMLQEIILSPVVGIDFYKLAPFSRAMLKSVNKVYFTGEEVFARFSDYPEALILGDRRYSSERKEDEEWFLEQDSEYLALCNVNDNLLFTFFPEADQPVGKPAWEGSDMPPRGSYGNKGQRKGPGSTLDGERAPRYPDSVAEDLLFKKIAAHVASLFRDRYRR